MERVLLAVIGLLLLTAGCSTDGAQQGETTLAQESPAEGLTVSGTGWIGGEPDTLRTTVGVEVEHPSVEEALGMANAAATKAYKKSSGGEDCSQKTRQSA